MKGGAMRECRHLRIKILLVTRPTDEPGYIGAYAGKWCEDCRDYIPQGEANNSGPHAEAVAIEIAAAEDAVWWSGEFPPDPCILDLPFRDCTACQTLWLAHAIATHDDRSGR
jgi:hypothetical protein